MKRIVFVLFIGLLSLPLLGQGIKELTLENEVKRVKDLFENDIYIPVRNYESNGSDYLNMEVEGYSVISAIKSKQASVDGLVAMYGEKYPHSPQLSLIKFYQSVYYFEKGDYGRSLSIIRSVNNKYLAKTQRWEYMFNKAYCCMRIGDNDEAMAGFRQLLAQKDTPYKSAASYYLGYLSYIKNDFSGAVELFKGLEGNYEYSTSAKYYISESYFMMKEYEKAISYGESVYDMLEGDFKLKSARILSQSYYELNQTREAKKYLELYSNQSENLSRKDNYYIGVVSYSLKAYYAAIDAFSKVTTQQDSLTQNGYLYLGNSYLAVKNKLNALSAFKEASMLNYDKTIQEESMFLYAKLSFDLNSDIAPFTSYMEKYPSSQKGDEIYNYIATSYLQNKNYTDAVDALRKVKNLTPEMVLNLQKASFFRAMQLLGMSSYRSASEYFDVSIKNGFYNQNLAMLAKFWLGEAQYRMNEFNKTLVITKALLANKGFSGFGEYPLALVNMGYSYFSLKDYPNAKIWFEKYLQLPPAQRELSLEIKTRLADCFYMERDYQRAAELYEEVSLKTFAQDDIYAKYMGALSYGLISQPAKKISMLKDIIKDKSNSEYYHISVYELGRTYVQEEDNSDAIDCFNMLLSDKRDSTFYTKSLLELGMINSNMDKYDQALKYFETIVEKYPLSADVQSALAGMESVYQLQNKPDEYLAYLDKVGMSSVKSADEKEQMLFNAAEQLYLAEKYTDALKSLTSFIEKYPQGQRTPQAYFYMAESYNKTGNPEFASDAYLKVMKTGEGAFVELATLYYGKVELGLEHFANASNAFESLESIAKLENNKFEAALGKMRAYYGNKQYDKTIEASAVVRASEYADSDIKREANYKMAKSYQLSGDREKALPVFEALAKDYSSPEGAESAYIMILNAYDKGDFDKVENLVYAFSDAGSGQMYWLAKSFIALGDSFAERGEWEQAKATFESVKEGYTPEKEHDDVLEQVEFRLSKINVENE